MFYHHLCAIPGPTELEQLAILMYFAYMQLELIYDLNHLKQAYLSP
jgi:hypothetical protein